MTETGPAVHVVTDKPPEAKKLTIQSLDSKVDINGAIADLKNIIYCHVEERSDHHIEMAFTQSGGIPDNLGVYLKKAIDEIAGLRKLPIVNVMINRVPGGKKTEEHKDYLKPTPMQPTGYPTIERWHLPLITNPLAKWWDEKNGEMIFTVGKWWGPIPYWTQHCVSNLGTNERIHLIVDLDSPNPIGSYA